MSLRKIVLGCLLGLLAQFALADISAEIAEASAPLTEGVPEVAVARLQALLNKDLPDTDWQIVAEKLAEAQVAAREPEDTLVLLAGPRLRGLPWAKFWRAQALAALNRWADALPLYEELTRDRGSPFHGAATFGTAEMLRAIGKRQQALRKLDLLFNDKEWITRAQLRAAELCIEMADAPNARRLLAEMRPTLVAERRERRVLRGRLELILQRPERAIGMFQALLKRPEGAPHATLIAALLGIADAHVQLKTPEAGDDVLERFIDRHPADSDLALLFEKLDSLYRAEHKPSRNELEKWVRRPEQPRRTFARWYLARMEVRAGRTERARQLFSDLRRTSIKSPAIAQALLEFAQFELNDGHFDEAIAILDDARLLRPDPALLTRINFLSANVNYLAKRFDTATAAFEQIAYSNSPWTKVALFNASSGWLQLGNHARFLADYSQLEKQGGDEQARANLRLEEGLMQAAKGDKTAAASLHQFIHDFPKNPRVSEAWVGLAELAFHSSPPRFDEARKNLARATELRPTAAAAERADYLTIWVEESARGDETKVIDLAKRFLEQHGLSPFASEVRMKLAELYYKRDILFEEGATNSNSYQRTIETYDQLASDKNESIDWRNKALFKKGLCLEKKNDRAGALAAFYKILENEARPDQRRELFWYYKAGFNAGRLLEEDSKWESAAAIYDSLAAAGGSRSEEAKARLNNLRLEHFLWTD